MTTGEHMKINELEMIPSLDPLRVHEILEEFEKYEKTNTPRLKKGTSEKQKYNSAWIIFSAPYVANGMKCPDEVRLAFAAGWLAGKDHEHI